MKKKEYLDKLHEKCYEINDLKGRLSNIEDRGERKIEGYNQLCDKVDLLSNDLRLSEHNLRVQFETNKELEKANQVNKDMFHNELETRDQELSQKNDELKWFAKEVKRLEDLLKEAI